MPISAVRTRLPVSGCLLLSAICLSSTASAQTNWARTYGGPRTDEGFWVQQTSDGGYIVTGSSYSFDPGASIYLVRTSAQGDTLWTRTYGERGYEGTSVQQTADGGYVIAAQTGPYKSGSDIYVIKTNTSGDTLWTRTYGGAGDDHGSVQQTTDGGYIIVGYTSSFGAGAYDVYLVKTDSRGDTLWTRTYGGAEVDEGYSAEQTADGGYIIAGKTYSFGAGGVDVWLLKTNAAGDTIWTKTYGGPADEVGSSVQQTTDGGYIVGGITNSFGAGGYDFYLTRTSVAGDTVWTRTYGGLRADLGHVVRQTADGGYIFVGTTLNFGSQRSDVCLIRTNAEGDTLWIRTYGGSYAEDGYCVRQTADGGYIVAGRSTSFGAGGRDVYLIKTDGKRDVGPIAIQSPPAVVDSSSAYVPRAVVRNYGLTSGSIVNVTMDIGSYYSQTVRETLVSLPLDTVIFPEWTAEPVGSVSVKCYTTMVGDEDPTNDSISDTVEVLPSPIHDVGAVAIVSPAGSVRAGDTLIPRARIRNFGNRQERFFDVRFRIGANYNEKVNVADALPAGSTAELTFPPWVAEAGDWAVSCSTMLGSDEYRDNDKVSSSVQVTEQTLAIEPDHFDRVEAGMSKSFSFYALIQGDTGGVVELARPSPPPGWSARLRNAAGTQDLTDTDGDGLPDLGHVAPGESSWFSLDVTAPSELRGDTATLSQVTLLVAGYVAGRPDIADTAMLTLTLVPELSIHNFPNPFSDHTSFVVGLPEAGKASLTVYTRTGERVCRVLTNADLAAGVHLVPWDGVNDNGRSIAPGTYEYLLDFVHAGKTERLHKKLVVTKQ